MVRPTRCAELVPTPPTAPLVGAAGFEQATWSTQNSRATRLRYAPSTAVRIVPLWIHASLRCSKLGSAAVEHPMGDPVADGDPKLFYRSTCDFEHCPYEPARRNDFGRHRRSVLGNTSDAAVGPNENHVKRNERVLHPHRDILISSEVKQHAVT